MNSFINILEKKFVPIASKIATQRHLVAIRDAFVTSMPLMILGSLVTLINTLPIPAFQNFMNTIFKGESWKLFGVAVDGGTFGILTLLVVFVLGAKLGKSYAKDDITCGVIATSSFFVMGGLTGLRGVGLFLGLIIAILSIEIFRRLTDSKALVIKMPDGVPEAVGRSFQSLFPAMITVSIFGLVFAILNGVFHIEDPVESFYLLIQQPFMGLTSNIYAAIIIPFCIQMLWFFGLHGGNVLSPFMESINTPAIADNIAAVNAGKVAPYIVNKPFMSAFVDLGGGGATLGLIIAIFLIARKTKSLMTVTTLSAPAAIFNINEPIIYGLPIVLNPLLFIPFVFGPVILSVVAFIATKIGLVPVAIAVIPWNMPPILGGIIATGSWQGGVLALLNLVIAIVIYLPFVKIIASKEASATVVSE